MAKVDEAMLKRVTINGLTCIVPEEIVREIKRLEDELEREKAAHQKTLISLTDDANEQAERIMANLFCDAADDGGVMKHPIEYHSKIDEWGNPIYRYRYDVKNRILQGLMGNSEKMVKTV